MQPLLRTTKADSTISVCCRAKIFRGPTDGIAPPSCVRHRLSRYAAIEHQFECEDCGEMEVKGLGLRQTYLLLGERERHVEPRADVPRDFT